MEAEETRDGLHFQIDRVVLPVNLIIQAKITCLRWHKGNILQFREMHKQAININDMLLRDEIQRIVGLL